MACRPLKDPIARHARPLIAMLEDKIRDEFGIEIGIGMEKEMWIHAANPQKGEEFFSSGTMAEYQKEQVRWMEKKLGHSLKTSHEGFYKETQPFQYELTTSPASPLRSVLRMDGQCQQLESMVRPDGQKSAHPFPIRQVDYDPSRPGNGDISGLHVNFSLWRDGKNQTSKGYEAVVEHLSDYLRSDTLLVSPSQNAFRRLDFLKSTQWSKEEECERRFEATLPNFEATPNETRYEFRYPSSDARHDLSVLMVMSAIYKGLRDPNGSNVANPSDISTEWEKALPHFQQGGRLMPDLAEFAQGDFDMQAHVRQLQAAILEAAQKGELTQPVRGRGRYVRRGSRGVAG